VFSKLIDIYKDDTNISKDTLTNLMNKSIELTKVWKKRRQLGPFDFAKWAPLSAEIEKIMKSINNEKLEKVIDEFVKVNLYNLELSIFCPIILEYYRLPENKEKNFVGSVSHGVLKNFSNYEGLFHQEIRVAGTSFNWNNSHFVEAITAAPNTRKKSLQIPLWIKPIKLEWVKKISNLIYNRGWSFCSDTEKILDQIVEEFMEKDINWLFERLRKFSDLVISQNKTTYYKIGNNCQDFVKESQRILFDGLIPTSDSNGETIIPVNEEVAIYCNRFLNSKAIKKHLNDLEYFDLAPKLMGRGITGFLEHCQKNEKNIISTYIAYAIVALRYFVTELSEHRNKATQPKLEYAKIEKQLYWYYAKWLHYYLTCKIHQTPKKQIIQEKSELENFASSLFLI